MSAKPRSGYPKKSNLRRRSSPPKKLKIKPNKLPKKRRPRSKLSPPKPKKELNSIKKRL